MNFSLENVKRTSVDSSSRDLFRTGQVFIKLFWQYGGRSGEQVTGV